MKYLKSVDTGIWRISQPVDIGPIKMKSNSTVIKLNDDSLWINSPPELNSQLIEELRGLGQVKYVIAPNLQHHLFFRQFLNTFPEAQGFCAPGLKIMNENDISLNNPVNFPWKDEVQGLYIEGLPVLNETIWYHHKTSTLIVTDLLFNFCDDNKGLMRFLARVLGVYQKLRMSRTMKLMIKDKTRFADSIKKLSDWDIKRIVLAHDQVIEKDCKSKLSNAFSWIL